MFNVSLIEKAAKNLEGVVKKTSLQYCQRLSKEYQSEIYLKREDLQVVRSYKIRGAYNKISTLSNSEKKQGIITASSGNHSQGVALTCVTLQVKGLIFVPTTTSNQKIKRVKYFGRDWVKIKLVGENFDETEKIAREYASKNKMIYICPFNDEMVIAGQGTIGKEIYQETEGKIDIILIPIGGGGLISGVGTYLKEKNPKIKVYGIEPKGAASMFASLRAGRIIRLEKLDTFVDGVAIKTVGHLTFKICQKYVDRVLLVPEGKVAQTVVDLYQNEGIIAEPAGALSVSVLDEISEEIKGKTVVCLISGGNNDLLRYPEILERSLVYQGRKHYFLIEFTQKPGQLKKFVNYVLGPTDDIVLFEYVKKNNREKGPALVGIELADRKDLTSILEKMKKFGFNYKIIEDKELLYSYLV